MTRTTPAQERYTQFSCPNPHCARFNRPGEGNIVHWSWTGLHKHIERLRCTACDREFSEREGTLMARSKLRGINPPLADSYGPPVWRGRAGVSCVCFPANLRTTPAGRPGDAVAYSLCHCPVVLHMLQKPKQASRNLTQEIELSRPQ